VQRELVRSRRTNAMSTRLRAGVWLRGLWRPGQVEQAEPYLYLLPALALTLLWAYWPIVGTVELAFYEWNLLPTSPRVWIGLENFEHLFRLPELGQAVGNTVLYIAGLVPFSVVLPVGVAIALNEITGRARALYRACIFLPVLMAPVVVAVTWRWIMNPSHGILNAALETVGVASINWLQNPAVAIWAIVLITGWKMFGLSVLIFSAGLTNIGREYLEAAGIDGANRWQTTWYVTLPLLSPTVMFVLLLTVLLSAQWSFPIINALTQGGPRGSTTNVYFLLWEFGFRNFNVGLSSAAAILFFVGFGALALAAMRLIDHFSFYDA
jgi:multiple sugar transport system permease protein